MAVRPQYHWTDQKIRVHTFCCLLVLLLGRLVEFQARELHDTEGLSGLLDRLPTVRLAMLLKPAGKGAANPAASGRWSRPLDDEARAVCENAKARKCRGRGFEFLPFHQ